jgi:hypothetical protein
LRSALSAASSIEELEIGVAAETRRIDKLRLLTPTLVAVLIKRALRLPAKRFAVLRGEQ